MFSSAAFSKLFISVGTRGMVVRLLSVGSVGINDVVVATGIFPVLDVFDTACT